MVGRPTSLKIEPLVLVALLALSVVPFPAASLEVSDPVEIEDTSSYDYVIRADGDDSGNFHIVYEADQSGEAWYIYYRKLDPTGETLEGPVELNPADLITAPGNKAIAVDKSGRAHVAFIAMTTSQERYALWYAQVGSDGTVSVPPKVIHYDDTSRPIGLDIEVDNSGNAYIVWDQSPDQAIMWAKVSSSGAILEDPEAIAIDLGFGGTVAYPRLGVTSSGESLVVWQQRNNQLPTTRTSIWFVHLNSQGSESDGPQEILSHTVYNLQYLEAAGNVLDNDLHVVYEQNGDIEYALVEEDGAVATTHTIYSNLVGEGTTPDVAIAYNGDMVISFGSRANAASDWYNYATAHWYDDDEWDDAPSISGTLPSSLGRPAAISGMGAVFWHQSGDIHMATLTKDAENHPPVPRLDITPNPVGVGQTVTFDGSGSTDPDQGDEVDGYLFDFGDGQTSGWIISATTTHTYTSAGTYTAELSVRDTQGLESTTVATDNILVTSEPVNQVPTAVLSTNPTTADTGQTVTFTGTSSTDPDGSVQLYRFDFGDGDETGWVSNGVQTHAYNSEGTYTATLWVKDDEGAESLPATAQVTVEHTNEPPTATIVSITPNPALQGETVTFVGNGEDSDGEIAAWVWESEFDGIIGTNATFTTDTLTPGTHTITFKVRDDENEWSEPVTSMLEVRANTPFTMEDLTDMPKQVYTDKVVEFRVRYTDDDNDRPTVLNLLIFTGGDWKSEEMLEVTTADKNYVDGKEYYFNKKFTDAGDYKYTFEFGNNKNPKRRTTSVDFKVQEAPGLFPAWEAAPAAGALMLAALAMAALARRRGALP